MKPRPLHFGQAPKGELNEKLRGSSSPTETPWSGQANFVENSLPDLHDGADEAVALGYRQLRGFRDAALLPFPDDDAVHDDIDGVFERLLQFDLVLVQIFDLAVHAHAEEAFAPDAVQHLLVHALLLADDRGEKRQFRAFAKGHELFDDLVDGLARDLPAADRAMGHADAGVEQSQVIVYFRDRPHGGTGVLAGSFLIDGDGGRQAFDGVHVGLVHLAEELPGVGGQALHVAPLPLRVDRIERQRGLSASGKPCDHDHLVAGYGKIQIL